MQEEVSSCSQPPQEAVSCNISFPRIPASRNPADWLGSRRMMGDQMLVDGRVPIPVINTMAWRT